MIFITEFEVASGEVKDGNTHIADHRKSLAEEKLGSLVAESFGWLKRGETRLHGPNLIRERHTLEIEAFAFPMDKWVEFKQKLSTAIRYGHGASSVESLLKELESFGKPAGAAKQQDNG